MGEVGLAEVDLRIGDDVGDLVARQLQAPGVPVVVGDLPQVLLDDLPEDVLPVAQHDEVAGSVPDLLVDVVLGADLPQQLRTDDVQPPGGQDVLDTELGPDQVEHRPDLL